ncbi:keratin, type I cytoskeletal 15 [Xenopus tropicalis]|uniref:Keratin, type I cytoskeletal 15 n=1 Tax=Xenopus tropicalis TaxID=8364 RepID=A0A803KG32_XENTR|nr:keratin, type I cytoskeletal 15 [Xenopus tropicalis]
MSFSGLDRKKCRYRVPGSREKWQSADLLPLSQKETLEQLNSRLAAYLEKVSQLEESNRHLEQKIQDLCERRARTSRDTSRYEKVIAEMEAQINRVKMENSELSLAVENTKLTANNFKAKYETELSLYQIITADIKEVKAADSHLEMETNCLKVELQIQTEELSSLKKDHQEDMAKLREDQSKCQVKVEVDSQPANDLTKTLEEMREHCKAIICNSNRKAEPWLVSKIRHYTHQNTIKPLQAEMVEVTLLRRTIQCLEAELETLHNMKASQRTTLIETEQNYATQLQRIQRIISRTEDELVKTRTDFKQMSADGGMLHYLKDLLQMEIKTYGQLMDVEEIRMEDMMYNASNGHPATLKTKQTDVTGASLRLPVYLVLVSESMSVISKSPFSDKIS